METACSNPAATAVAEINPVFSDLSQKSPPHEWLWRDRIPFGAVTLIVGDPDLGKSLVTLDWSARVTQGAAWPDQQTSCCPPSQVLLLNAEDGASLRPRLEAAGANLEQILVLDAVQEGADNSRTRPVSLNRDLPVIDKALTMHPNCRMVVIDPISAYLRNGNNNEQVRTVFEGLRDLAIKHRVAVIGVTHLNKRDGSRAKYRTMGALAFVAAARVVWGVLEDPECQRQLFLRIKNNGSSRRDGLAFRLRSDEKHDVGVVAWDEEVVEKSIEELLGKSNRFNLKETTYRAQEAFAVDWLRAELSDGPQNAFFLRSDASGQQITRWQLHDASKKLNVVKRKSSFIGGWTWELPESEEPGEEHEEDEDDEEEDDEEEEEDSENREQPSAKTQDPRPRPASSEDPEDGPRRGESKKRFHDHHLEIMTERMERRIKNLQQPLLELVRERNDLSPDDIQENVQHWLHKLYREEKRFLNRYFDIIRPRLTDALGGAA